MSKALSRHVLPAAAFVAQTLESRAQRQRQRSAGVIPLKLCQVATSRLACSRHASERPTTENARSTVGARMVTNMKCCHGFRYLKSTSKLQWHNHLGLFISMPKPKLQNRQRLWRTASVQSLHALAPQAPYSRVMVPKAMYLGLLRRAGTPV